MIDDRQRIVAWSYAAFVTLDVSEEAALGRSCHELVRGRDHSGRPICRLNCPALKAIKKGHLFARCSLLLSGQEPSRKRFIGELVALPAGPGGALVTLSERRQGTSVPAAGGQAASVAWRAGDSVAHLVHDVAALATLTTSLSPGRFESSIDQTLDWLRQAANAESAELFVVEPRGGDMLLTAYRGPFRKAFEQITCFHPGEGFPGLIQRQASLSLPEASPKTLDTCERR